MVALGDAFLDGGRYAQAGEDVVQEGHDVVGAFGAAEGDDQDGVVGSWASLSKRVMAKWYQ